MRCLANFGDDVAYAKAKNEPLPFKGGDFSLTDIVAAIYADTGEEIHRVLESRARDLSR